MRRPFTHLIAKQALAAAIAFAVAATCFNAEAQAKVKEISLNELATISDWIVVTTVTKVEPGAHDPERQDDRKRPTMVATAQVVETWKGSELREVRYYASPSWTCDTSFAKKGERVVLFLTKQKDSKLLRITHSGRGRMPMRNVKDKRHATISDDVILPDKTPTISETKTVNITPPSMKPGEPGIGPLTFTHEEISIELGTLRNLVKLKAP